MYHVDLSWIHIEHNGQVLFCQKIACRSAAFEAHVRTIGTL
ncbi:hypothetical protein BpHYR1_034774 [Brachionus plicatilis]|uniref:Uncharacterized protein n=1 Tax=Brachionus plicatilis TaxID=10195 RepID=A0A3M7S1V7_BRAPC|nr:hypothetical protein BpHYR1_034774 [Brachionus plicatilis]